MWIKVSDGTMVNLNEARSIELHADPHARPESPRWNITVFFGTEKIDKVRVNSFVIAIFASRESALVAYEKIATILSHQDISNDLAELEGFFLHFQQR